MAAQKTTEETVHLSRERLHQLSSAWQDTDRALCDRAVAVYLALGDGVEVKTMAADLAAAARADAAVNAVSAVHLGYARFATTAAEIIGVDLRAWVKRSPADVARLIRTVKRDGVGSKRLATAIRDAVKPIPAEKKADREEAAIAAVETIRAEVPAEKKTTPRQKKTAEPEQSGAVKPGKLAGPEALAAVRAVTAYLADGGAYTPDLASAVAELTAELSTARKRGAAAARKTSGATVETVAA